MGCKRSAIGEGLLIGAGDPVGVVQEEEREGLERPEGESVGTRLIVNLLPRATSLIA